MTAIKRCIVLAVMACICAASAACSEEAGNSGEQEPCAGENCEKVPEPEPCEGNDCQPEPESCDLCVSEEKKCEDNRILECRKNAENCFDWAVADDCAGQGMYCKKGNPVCISCESTCDGQEPRCDGELLATCRADENGCAVWQSASCSDDRICRDGVCVSACSDNCTPGEKKCGENGILECRTGDEGCPEWREVETCGFAQFCYDDKSPKCEYACGDECEPFSIVLLPDTQKYVLTDNGIFKKQTEWIVENQKKENIRFVLHLGDVDDGNAVVQYERAVDAMDVLAKANVPYSVATGNHEYLKGSSDISYVTRSRTLFGSYFNDEYIKKGYKDSSWFHGFESTGSMYATFSVGHIKFAVIALEYAPRKDILCWADNLISEKFRDHYVILTTHGYIDRGASDCEDCSYVGLPYSNFITVGARGRDIYEELAARHSNIIMVACGHMAGSEHRNRKGYTGNSIHETLVDYQKEKPCTKSSCEASSCESAKDGGNGWLRLMTIDPKNVQAEDGSLVPNVQARTISVLEYYQKTGIFYCSSKNGSADNKYYSSSVDNVKHTYSTTFDFSKPIQYQYSDNDSTSFIVRDISQDDHHNQIHPAISMNRSSGSFFTVWEDDSDQSDGAGNHDIAARGFCAGGCEEIAQFVVNTDVSGQQAYPDVAQDKEGNFVVVWEENRNGDSQYDIVMRGFNADGSERFAQQTVNSEKKLLQRRPSIAMAPDGRFVVAWHDTSFGESTPQIVMRGFNADGSERFHDRRVMDKVEGVRQLPDIGMADDGSFVITWQDDGDNNGSFQIMAKGYDDKGEVRLPEFTVNVDGDGQQKDPAIGMNADGQFYIAYEDEPTGRIKVRGYDKDRKTIFEDQAFSKDGQKSVDPAVCVADTGKVVITWQSKPDTDKDLKYRTISSDKTLNEEASVSIIHNGTQRTPAVGCSADSRSVILYADDNNENGIYNILGRGYN